MKAIKGGYLSDPPGISLYFQMGVDKEHGNLPIYRCVQGTNSAEGGVHHSIRRRLPISGVSPRHASARLHDYVLMHNLVVRKLLNFLQSFNEIFYIRLGLSIVQVLHTRGIMMCG